MKIVILTHYFPPEIGAPQARLGDFARIWASCGNDVHVVTTMPNHPTGIVPAEYRGKVRVQEFQEQYAITRCWSYATPNQGIFKKTLGHLSFMLTAPFLAYRKIGRVDVMIVSSPTFFSIASAIVIAKLKGAKLVVEVRDLWPAIFVELGVLSNSFVIWVLERFELLAYRIADAVVVVTEGFRQDIVSRGVDARKVSLIPNGVDPSRFLPCPRTDSKWKKAFDSVDRVAVVYIGAHGISQGLTTIVDAARSSRVPTVRYILVGDGADAQRVLDYSREVETPNFKMLPPVAREEVKEVLSAADIAVVTLRKIPLFEKFIPSKIFELLAAGKPIVAAVAGEAADILREAGAIVVPPEDSHAISEAVDMLALDLERQGIMATTGRDFVSARYSRLQLAGEYKKIFDSLFRG